VTIYRLRSFAPSNRIIAVQRFSAANDDEAVTIASGMVDGAAAFAAFDLWEGERRVEGVAPTMRKGKP
jgi:hypothetical protein